MRGTNRAGDEHFVPLAKSFLRHVDEVGAILVLPSVVLAEFSVKLTSDEYDEYMSMLPKKTLEAAFDTNCVRHFQKIWRSNEELAKKLRDAQDLNRVAMKFDYQILSIAAAHNAVLYTEDGPLRSLAAHHVAVGSITDFSEPEKLL